MYVTAQKDSLMTGRYRKKNQQTTTLMETAPHKDKTMTVMAFPTIVTLTALVCVEMPRVIGVGIA
jgi:hypothetical protein